LNRILRVSALLKAVLNSFEPFFDLIFVVFEDISLLLPVCEFDSNSRVFPADNKSIDAEKRANSPFFFQQTISTPQQCLKRALLLQSQLQTVFICKSLLEAVFL
jgi:hypothetical protein